jgi:hypothetical protein
MSEDAPRFLKRRPDWDSYSALVASFVGLVAVVLAGYTAYLQRQQVRAQVWPRLETYRYGSRHSFVAVNRGVGPARVKAVKVTVDGKPQRGWDDVFRALRYDGGYVQSQISGQVVSPGLEIDVLMAHPGDEGLKMFDLVTRSFFNDKAEHKLSMLICYCSVFDECWLTSLGHVGMDVDEDAEIGRCPIAKDDQFRQ